MAIRDFMTCLFVQGNEASMVLVLKVQGSTALVQAGTRRFFVPTRNLQA